MDLLEKYHPILIDRMVCFLYTSRYSAHVDKANTKIGNLSYHHSLPDNATCTSFELAMDTTQFHIAMYGMSEALEYPQLMSYAFDRLALYYLEGKRNEERVKQLIKVSFEPLGSSRLCKDEVGVLKGLGIAAVLVHEKLHWSGAQMDRFRDLLAEELDQSMWKEYRACYKQVKNMNENLHGGTDPGMASLTFAMGKVGLDAKKPAKAPTVVGRLHLLFDEYAYWTLKALRKKTGLPAHVLNSALPKIARQSTQPPYCGYWERRFGRPAKQMCSDPNGGRTPANEPPKKAHGNTHDPLPSSPRIRAHDSPQSKPQTQPPNTRMHTTHGLKVGTSDGVDWFFGSPPGTFGIPSGRKIATPGGRFSSKSPDPMIIIVEDHGKPTTMDRNSASNVRSKTSQSTPKTSQVIDKATLFSPTYGKRFISILTAVQMQALEDAGVAKKAYEYTKKVPEHTNKTRENTRVSSAQVGGLTPAPAVAVPTMRTFGGLGGRTLNLNATPIVQPSYFPFGGQGLQDQAAGSGKKGTAGGRKKFYDPERNKENIPWSGSQDDEEEEDKAEQDVTMGGHEDLISL